MVISENGVLLHFLRKFEIGNRITTDRISLSVFRGPLPVNVNKSIKGTNAVEIAHKQNVKITR